MCCPIILNIFIIVIMGHLIFNCMIHYNVALYVMIKTNIVQFCGPVEIIVGQWKLLWAGRSGNLTSPPGYWLLKLNTHAVYLLFVIVLIAHF